MDFCKNESLVKLFSKTNNSGSVYFELLYKIYCPCIIFAGLVSILLNGILMTIRSNRRLRTSPMVILSLNLALTDEIASILTVIVIIYNSYLPVVFGLNNNNCFSITIEVFRISSLVASVLHLLALTWLHYSAITNPLHHRLKSHLQERRVIHLLSAVCWIIPLVLFTYYFWSIPCQGFRSKDCLYSFLLFWRFRFTVLLCFGIPLIVMFFAYLRIFYVLNKQSNFERTSKNNCDSKSNHKINVDHWKSYRKTMVTSLIIVGTYLICWMPNISWIVFSCVDGCPFPIIEQSMTTRASLGFFTNSLVVIKAIVDPFIYSYRMKEIKLAIKSVFCSEKTKLVRQCTLYSNFQTRSSVKTEHYV